METVLDPSYKPIGQQQHQLFRLQNDYMYAVFTTTLFLDQGKTLVRQFQSTRDAQKIYAALKEHCTKSVRADITAGDLLTAITNDRLTADTWSGTREAFLLHWLDLVRQHTELTSPNAPLTQEVLRTLLDNAVSFDPDLARVKATQRQLNMINPGMPMNYDSYVSLLQSTAETIDATGKALASFPTNVASRRVYVAASAPPVISDFDHSTNPYSAFQSRSTSVPRLPPDLYSQLDPTTRRAWSDMTSHGKSIILRATESKSTPQSIVKQPAANAQPSTNLRHVNLHDISAHDYFAMMHNRDLGMGSVPDVYDAVSNVPDTESPDPDNPFDDNIYHDGTQDLNDATLNDNPILANVMKQRPMRPGELRRTLSTSLATPPGRPDGKSIRKTKVKQHEVTIDGRLYRSVNNHKIVYHVSKSSTSNNNDSLQDRGANGGIAGRNVRVLSSSHKYVNVEGIGNHQITNIPIVTCAGKVMTDKGPVVAIMNQFAHVANGSTILSSPQMEHFGVEVNDKSSKVGGKQSLTTLDGYVIALTFKNGLPYVDMTPPTDRDMDDLPQVVLTSDEEWDPSILDSDPLSPSDLGALSDRKDPDKDSQRPFNRKGDLKACRSVVHLPSDDKIADFPDIDFVLPTNGLYEYFPRNTYTTTFGKIDYFDDLFFPERNIKAKIDDIVHANEARRRPSSVLFSPGTSLVTDLDSSHLAPTKLKDPVKESSLVFDVESALPIPPGSRKDDGELTRTVLLGAPEPVNRNKNKDSIPDSNRTNLDPKPPTLDLKDLTRNLTLGVPNGIVILLIPQALLLLHHAPTLKVKMRRHTSRLLL